MRIVRQLYADELSVARNPIASTESDSHGLRIAMPRKLPRNVLDVFGIFVFLTHADPKGRNITYLLLPIRVPEVELLQGSGFGAATDWYQSGQVSRK